jgi:ribosomal protein L40E
MARFPESESRLFSNVFVCMVCNAKNRGNGGKKPAKCRKCTSNRLRLKHKTKKASK